MAVNGILDNVKHTRLIAALPTPPHPCRVLALVPLAIVHQVQACLNRDMKLSFVLVALCIALQVVAQTTVVTDAQLKGLTIAKVHKLLGVPLRKV